MFKDTVSQASSPRVGSKEHNRDPKRMRLYLELCHWYPVTRNTELFTHHVKSA